MELKNLLAKVKTLTSAQFNDQFNSLLRDNYHYYNLDENNKKLILQIIEKYKPRIREGRGIDSVAIREESYRLYENRLKLKLTEKDLADIKEILNYFKK